MRLIHTFVLPDLLLVTMLLAVAIMPLGQFALSRPDRPRLPRLRSGPDDDDSPRSPRLGDGVLAGAGAGT